ncbi:MAG: glycerol kinase GlpK [Coriobacteriia bacterium]|nr:glycerol kinase GlpK [Coriobacteriia bacterium]
MSKRYVAALDQGTASSRCIIFNELGHIVSSAQQDIECTYQKPGWVQQDATDIWASQVGVMARALTQAKLDVADIAAVGIANQRETTIVWDKSTGIPVYDAIVWQCRRSADFIDSLKRAGLEETIRDKTGLVLDPYFSASKIDWILSNVDGARERAVAGELLFGTVDTWLIWNLTNGKVHATDYTNASRTMLFNIHSLRWDEELLAIFDIPRSMLPEVRVSSGDFGVIDNPHIGRGIPIAGVAGDQQAALFGQCCFNPGEAKSTYGTGCFMLMNTGREPVASKHGLLTTIAYSDETGVTYALEGSIFNAGSAINWLRDGLRLVRSAEETSAIASSVPDTRGCYVVTAFNGLGAPYWNKNARGAIVGLTQSVTNKHVVRATLESLCYQVNDVLRAMEQDSRVSLKLLRVDGGVSRNDFCMQFQADILGREVHRPAISELTALGAAFMAGLKVGIWNDVTDLPECRGDITTYSSHMAEETRAALVAGWEDALARVQ